MTFTFQFKDSFIKILQFRLQLLDFVLNLEARGVIFMDLSRTSARIANRLPVLRRSVVMAPPNRRHLNASILPASAPVSLNVGYFQIRPSTGMVDRPGLEAHGAAFTMIDFSRRSGWRPFWWREICAPPLKPFSSYHPV